MLSPPLLVSFSSLDSYLSSLDSDLIALYEKEIVSLYEKSLPPVVSTTALAVLFGYSTKFVVSMSKKSEKFYRYFTISKGRKKRNIEAPKVALKIIQKWFGFHLSNAIDFDSHVFGYVNGRSSTQAALNHINARWVYSIDIEDFFPSTSSQLIYKKLIQIGYSIKAAFLITNLMCYRNRLPQGSPASPVLSNLAMMPIDYQLKALAEKYNVRMTRFADDIVFSGIEDFPDNLDNDIEDIFEPTAWNLNRSKVYFAKLPQRIKVHGLLVHGSEPRLTKGYRNKIRAYKHLSNAGKIKAKDKKRIKGHLTYADSIEKLKSKQKL